MTPSSITQFHRREATVPHEYVDQLRRTRLGQIAQQMAALAVEHATLLQSANPETAASIVPIITSALDDGMAEVARRAANVAYQAHLSGIVQQILEGDEWELHAAGGFLRDRMSELLDKACHYGAATVLTTYHAALRDPGRFCQCGAFYENGEAMQRKVCKSCWQGGERIR